MTRRFSHERRRKPASSSPARPVGAPEGNKGAPIRRCTRCEFFYTVLQGVSRRCHPQSGLGDFCFDRAACRGAHDAGRAAVRLFLCLRGRRPTENVPSAHGGSRADWALGLLCRPRSRAPRPTRSPSSKLNEPRQQCHVAKRTRWRSSLRKCSSPPERTSGSYPGSRQSNAHESRECIHLCRAGFSS